MKIFKKQSDQLISKVVILSIIFGFAAGVVGQIVADVYVDPYQQDLLYPNLNINGNIGSNIPELRRVNRFLGIEQDFEVSKSINKVEPSLAGIYRKKSGSNNPLNEIYLPDELLTNGFILTSDGWLVSFGNAFESLATSNLVVLYQGKVYDIDELITDSTTEVVFLKIAAGNLPVVVLGNSGEANLGQLAIVINNLDEAVVVNIKNPNYLEVSSANNYVISSEQYGKAILLTNDLEQTFLGSPLVNLAGEVIGVIKQVDDGLVTAVPIDQFRSIILDVLRSSIVKRPLLGVDYIDLASINGLSKDLTQGLNQGALIWKNPSRNTPAFAADLREDDIILNIDGQAVDSNSNLTQLIQQYQAGDQIDIEILRDGQTLSRTATLVIDLD